MIGNYDQVIQQTVDLLTRTIIAQESDMGLRQKSLNIDCDVQALVRRIGRDVVQSILGVCAERVTGEKATEGLVVQRRSTITVDSIFGPVAVESPYLWKPGQSARPVRTELGLTDRCRSQGVERALTDFGAEVSFGQAAQRFQEHYGWTLGRTSILRIVERRAEEAEMYLTERLSRERVSYEKPLEERAGVAAMLVELDGSTVHTGTLVPADTDEKTPKRQQPKRKRISKWCDVRIGLARPLDKDIDSTCYVGRMESYPEVVSHLFCAAVEQGMSCQTKVVAVGDGGNGLREELAKQFPNFQYIYDRPHLKKHLFETAESIGLESTDRQDWVTTILDRVHEGRVAEVLDELKGGQPPDEPKKRVDQLHRHLSRFSDAVHYDFYREQGWPMGSGRVESAHRYIPQRRLKLPGCTWDATTINPMLSLRVLRANGWWDDFWVTRSSAMAAA